MTCFSPKTKHVTDVIRSGHESHFLKKIKFKNNVLYIIKDIMPTRNPCKQWFMTFPKSPINKIEFRDTLLRFEPTFYKIVEEKHKDGTPHLHAVVVFKGGYSKAFILKYFKEKYSDSYKRIHVETVRSIKHALGYLSKEDIEPLETGPYVDNRNPQRAALHKIRKKAMETADQIARVLGYRDHAHSVEEGERSEREEQQKIYEEFIEWLKVETERGQDINWKNYRK